MPSIVAKVGDELCFAKVKLPHELQHDASSASFGVIPSICNEGIRSIPHISRYIYPHKWVYLYLIL
jgi:hypothetical protein